MTSIEPARTGADDGSGDQPPHRALRLVTPAVVALIVAATLGVALLGLGVTRQQAKTLLGERANELTAILSVSLSEARSSLRSAGLVTQAPHGIKTFETLAAEAAKVGATTVVLRQTPNGLITVVAGGPLAASPGTPVDPSVRTTAERAAKSSDLVAEIVQRSASRHVILALAIPGSTLVAYTDTPLSPATAAPTNPDSPYRELNVAVYAAPVARADRLVLVSGSEPNGHQEVAQRPLMIGTDSWTVRVSARGSLTGSLATAFPWMVFGTGLLISVLLGFLVNTLVRRRAYLVQLVEERTSSMRQAQLAAEHANQAKSEFLSRMSHELRTPLNAVMGFAQLLEMDDLDADQRENLGQISRGGAHLLDLINEILDISQIESGNMSISVEAVSVAEVVNAATRLLAPLADDRSIHLLVGTDHDPDWFVHADQQRLTQVLLNLLSNGIKYNHHGGSVSVSCFEPSPGQLRLQVTDTGPGIPAEKQHLLFVPFERLGAEHLSVQGTGIGLALSQRLAEAMGTSLHVESSAGRGSTFWLDLPLVDAPAGASAPEVINTASDGPRHEPIRILHIEDNPTNVALIERALAQRPDVTVVPTMQGRMGIDLARRHQPALILLDLNLADVPGDEVLAALHADPATAHIPVIVVSADAMPRQIERLMSHGATAYLTKPVDIRQLLTLVDEAIERAAGAASGHSSRVGGN